MLFHYEEQDISAEGFFNDLWPCEQMQLILPLNSSNKKYILTNSVWFLFSYVFCEMLIAECCHFQSNFKEKL